jgi:hypothetical protein
MNESSAKAPKNGKPAGAGESPSEPSYSAPLNSVQAQMMPVYALGQANPIVPTLASRNVQKQSSTSPDEDSESTTEEPVDEPDVQAQMAPEAGGPPVNGGATESSVTTSARPSWFSSAVNDGLRGATRPLPAIGRIQESFGGHDVSHVRVQVGGPATHANRRMGARAYTSGNRIAFRQEPDVRLAAHEAAHVVQQGQGVRLKGGVGEAGDVYEQQADRAADAVVAGQSAEEILDQNPGGNTGGAAVQKACDCGGTCDKCSDEAPVQHELEVNAQRRFEPMVTTAGGEPEREEQTTEGEGAEAAGPAPAAAEHEEEGSAREAAEATEPRTPGTEAPSPAVNAGPAPAAEGARRTESSGRGEPACQGGGGIHAECYTEAYEEPEEEPEEEPQDPPSTEAEENMDSDSPEAEERDDCPIEEAVANQAPVTRSETEGVAASAEGSRTAPATAEAAEAGPPEAAALGNQVAGNETSAEAALSPIDSAIAQTEEQRDETVGAYQLAFSQLRAYGQNSSALAGPVTFAADDAGPEGVAAQRQAENQAQEFFAGAADQINEAIDLALVEVPGRLGGLAENIKVEIDAAMESEKAAISTRINLARGQARARAARARPQVVEQHNSAVTSMEAATAAAITQITSEHQSTLEQINELETRRLDNINALYATSRQNHEAVGVTVGAEAHNHGEQYYNEYERCKIHRSDGFFTGHLTDRRAEAQQNASRETAEGYRKNLEKTAKQQAREAVKGRKQDRCGLIATARRTRETLDSQFNNLVTSLQQGLETGRQNAAANRDQLLASIDTALRSTLRTLDQQENSQRQALNDTGYLQQVAIEQAAHSAAASIQSSVGQAADSAQRALAQIRESFGESPAPDPESLGLLLGPMSRRISEAIEGLSSQVETGLARSEEHLAAAGARALTALANVTQNNDEQAAGVIDGISGSMSDLVANARVAFAQQTSQYQQQTEAAMAGGSQIFTRILSGFQTAVNTLITNIQSALTDSVGRLEESLRTSLAGVDCEIPKQAMKAASKEQPAWKRVVAIILIIAVIIVVALVIGPAVIGAVGAAASALGAGAAAGVIGTLVGGAIVGAAASATIQVLNNWRTGERLMRGVGQAAIMGAVGGFLGAGAGALVGRFVSGAVLQFASNIAADALLELGTELVTGEFSWESFGMALAMSVASGGFGEIPRIRRIQARMTFRGARSVRGARAQAYAETLRPPVHAEAPPSRPRTETEPGAPARPREETAATTETARPRSEAEVETAAAATAAGPRPETDLNARAARVDDAELANTTTNRTQVGDAEHVVSMRRNGDHVEAEICSAACGALIDRLSLMINSLPGGQAHARLRRELASLRARVGEIETHIQNATMSHQDVITASADIAARFRDLGSRHPDLGTALDRPRVFGDVYEPAATPAGTERVSTDRLGVTTGERRTVDVNRHRSLDIPEGTPVLYVLRDRNTGAVLKVGQTTAGPSMTERFGRYDRAGRRLGMNSLELEVTPVTNLRGRTIETPESVLRARMEDAGHILPWDYTGRPGRLGRVGPGTPFESLPGGSRLRREGWRWSKRGVRRGYLVRTRR